MLSVPVLTELWLQVTASLLLCSFLASVLFSSFLVLSPAAFLYLAYRNRNASPFPARLSPRQHNWMQPAIRDLISCSKSPHYVQFRWFLWWIFDWLAMKFSDTFCVYILRPQAGDRSLMPGYIGNNILKAITLPQFVLSGVTAPYENLAPFVFYQRRH